MYVIVDYEGSVERRSISHYGCADVALFLIRENKGIFKYSVVLPLKRILNP